MTRLVNVDSRVVVVRALIDIAEFVCFEIAGGGVVGKAVREFDDVAVVVVNVEFVSLVLNL